MSPHLYDSEYSEPTLTHTPCVVYSFSLHCSFSFPFAHDNYNKYVFTILCYSSRKWVRLLLAPHYGCVSLYIYVYICVVVRYKCTWLFILWYTLFCDIFAGFVYYTFSCKIRQCDVYWFLRMRFSLSLFLSAVFFAFLFRHHFSTAL